MIKGKDAVILDIDEIRIIERLLRSNWTKERIMELQKLVVLDIISKLTQIIKSYDSEGK